MIYLYLFVSFLQVGMFSFGGGYAAMPLIQEQVVTIHHWLDISEFTDLVTISQMTPGPISINAATFVGIKVAGIPGAVVATGGCILPSCVVVIIIAKVYLKYRKMGMLQGILNALRPAVIAMIASAGISILITAFWGTAVIKDKYKLEPGDNFCDMFCIAAKIKDESHWCYGFGRDYETGAFTNKKMIQECPKAFLNR